jgi:hypothetical protein
VEVRRCHHCRLPLRVDDTIRAYDKAGELRLWCASCRKAELDEKIEHAKKKQAKKLGVPDEYLPILRWIREKLDAHADRAPLCPCCDQHYARRQRILSAGLANDLIEMARTPTIDGWIDIADVGPTGGDYAKLVHWGLIEHAKNEDPSKGYSGRWKVTDKGWAFLRGAITVPKAVFLLPHNKFSGFSEAHTNIHEALGSPFDIRDLTPTT